MFSSIDFIKNLFKPEPTPKEIVSSPRPIDSLDWDKVRVWVGDIHSQRSYYCGRTLFIDKPDQCFAFNLNGKGFTFLLGSGGLNEDAFIMPDDIKLKINELYQETRGD